jgi:hypothetical protein
MANILSCSTIVFVSTDTICLGHKVEIKSPDTGFFVVLENNMVGRKGSIRQGHGADGISKSIT